MPTYIVTLKDSASVDEVAAVKSTAIDQGGTITHEYTLIKAFAVSFPEGHVQMLDQNASVEAVEADQEVKI